MLGKLCPTYLLTLFSGCGYFTRLTIASLSFVCSIILRRYYNAQLAFSSKARLRTGLRFFPAVGISQDSLSLRCRSFVQLSYAPQGCFQSLRLTSSLRDCGHRLSIAQSLRLNASMTIALAYTFSF